MNIMSQIAAMNVSPMMPMTSLETAANQAGGFQELLAQVCVTANTDTTMPTADLKEMISAMFAQIFGQTGESAMPQKAETLLHALLQAVKKNQKEAETTLMDGSMLLQIQGLMPTLAENGSVQMTANGTTQQLQQIAEVLLQSSQAPELVKQIRAMYEQQMPMLEEQAPEIHAKLALLEQLVQQNPVRVSVKQNEVPKFEQVQAEQPVMNDRTSEMQQAYTQMKNKVGTVDITFKEAEVKLLKESKQEPNSETAAATETTMFTPMQMNAVKEIVPELETEQPVFKQITDEFQVQAARGKDEFVMKLKPEGLGEITVKMTMQESGKIALQIQTSSHAVKNLLNQELVQLKEALRPYQAEVHEVTSYVANEHFSSQQHFQQPNRNLYAFQKNTHIALQEEHEEEQAANVILGLNRLNTYV